MTPGIHNIPMAEYLADPCPEPSLSSGLAAMLLTRSPRHVWEVHPRLNIAAKVEQSDAMDVGSIAHALVLEGDDSRICAIDAEDWRSKAARESRDAARAKGLLPILKHKLADVRAMVGAARNFVEHSALKGVFEVGAPEMTMIWQEGESWCRARPDWLNPERALMIHYKTTQGSAEPSAWIRNQMLPMGYDIAAAFYWRGYISLDAPPKAECIFLVQESTPPYACSWIGLDPMLMDAAERKVARAIGIWQHCMKTNSWPAYSGQVAYAEAPAWVVADVEKMENNPYQFANDPGGLVL